MRVHPSGQGDEKWQRIYGQREQCPADDAQSDNIEKDANDDHGDGSRDNSCKGTPPPPPRRIVDIAEDVRRREQKFLQGKFVQVRLWCRDRDAPVV